MPGSAPSSSDTSVRTSAESSTTSTRTGRGPMSEQFHRAGYRRPRQAPVQRALDVHHVVAGGRQALDQGAAGAREEADLARLVVAQVLGQHRDLLGVQVIEHEARVAGA